MRFVIYIINTICLTTLFVSCSTNEFDFILSEPIAVTNIKNGIITEELIDSSFIGCKLKYYGSSFCPPCVLSRMPYNQKQNRNDGQIVMYANPNDYELAVHVSQLKAFKFPILIDTTGTFESFVGHQSDMKILTITMIGVGPYE